MEIRLNKKQNRLEEHYYHHNLQNVEKPQLYRKVFEYGTVPKTVFNMVNVPMITPKKFWITDTTFRDGQQAREAFTVKQIVDLFTLLNKLGGPNGIIKQSEFFIYSKKDREAVEKCRELGFEFPEITSWIRANEKDFELVKEMGLRETGILVSCSDYHIFKKMNLNRKQAMDKYLAIIKKALEKGIVPRCHFEDITRADFYGFVVPFAIELMRLSKESGIPIKIRACDTMGYGLTYPGVSMPRSVQGIIYGLQQYAGVPSSQIEWHGHNDFYKVVTNSTTAWLYGSGGVNTTMLGIGERTGNCPLEAMAIEYASIRGTTDGMDLSVITEIAEYFEKEIGMKIPENTPFVGTNFNTTKAGIHADGMLKDAEIYNIFDTEKLLNRPPLVAVDQFSGVAGIAYWLNNYYRIPAEQRIDKKSNLIITLKNKIDSFYKEGRTTVMSNEELDKIFAETDSALHAKCVDFMPIK